MEAYRVSPREDNRARNTAGPKNHALEYRGIGIAQIPCEHIESCLVRYAWWRWSAHGSFFAGWRFFASCFSAHRRVGCYARATQTVISRGANTVGTNGIGRHRWILLACETANDRALRIEKIDRHELARLCQRVIDDTARRRICSARVSARCACASSSAEAGAVNPARLEQVRGLAWDFRTELSKRR